MEMAEVRKQPTGDYNAESDQGLWKIYSCFWWISSRHEIIN